MGEEMITIALRDKVPHSALLHTCGIVLLDCRDLPDIIQKYEVKSEGRDDLSSTVA